MEMQQLLESCKCGCRNAQMTLYSKYKPEVRKVAYRFCQNPQDIKDIVQETFIKIFLNLKYLKSSEALECWIRKIARNTAIAHNLKHKKKFLEDVDSVSEVFFMSNSFAADRNICDVSILVAQLPEGYRTVLNLYIDGYSHKEIANILKISEGTSKSQVFHARKSLKILIS